AQPSADAGGIEQNRHRLRRQRALLEPAAHLLLVEVDERRVRLRVVATDYLDELAVARRARIGGDDAVDRVLLRPDPRQPELHCHWCPFSRYCCVSGERKASDARTQGALVAAATGATEDAAARRFAAVRGAEDI